LRNALVASLLALLLVAAPAPAAMHEARIPLHDGRLQTSDLTSALLNKCHVHGVELDAGSINLRGFAGSLFVQALNASLGEGCHVALDGDNAEALILKVDPKKLPHSFDSLRKATRVFTAAAAPDWTAAQRRNYGIWMPPQVDPHRPMVVLVHGLDCNRSNWYPMAELLIGQGYQVAYFTYPSDEPLEESATLFTRDMRAVREVFPEVKLDVIAHSMGGLVARDYIEGDDYAGGVEHLVMLGTPNAGSRWAAYRWGLELQEHYHLWKSDPNWHWTWAITDGLGEAGRDLKPTSVFLKSLNARPRRADVKYTIVAGDQHPAVPITANALDGAANIVPNRAAQWWGFRQTESALHRAAAKVRAHTGSSDGPVSVKSTRLEGVDDFVELQADHAALYYPVDGQQPAAWPIIRDRLAH
jgi:pimeloyl-ACP methyl ester carboxylesterase